MRGLYEHRFTHLHQLNCKCVWVLLAAGLSQLPKTTTAHSATRICRRVTGRLVRQDVVYASASDPLPPLLLLRTLLATQPHIPPDTTLARDLLLLIAASTGLVTSHHPVYLPSHIARLVSLSHKRSGNCMQRSLMSVSKLGFEFRGGGLKATWDVN